MARTLDGKLTGRAAVEDRAENRGYVLYLQMKADIESIQNEQNELIQRCDRLMGTQAFLEWYDDNNNIPYFGSVRERVEILRAKVQELETARYNQVDKLVGDECADPTKIADVAESIPPTCSLGHDMRG